MEKQIPEPVALLIQCKTPTLPGVNQAKPQALS